MKGHGTNETAYLPFQVESVKHKKVVHIACGKNHVAVVTSEGIFPPFFLLIFLGEVITWGPEFQVFSTQSFSRQKVVQVECGKYFTVALTENGQVYTWGKGNKGALGHGDYGDKDIPTQIKDIPKVKQISCGNSHVIALTTSDTLLSWGNSKYGR